MQKPTFTRRRLTIADTQHVFSVLDDRELSALSTNAVTPDHSIGLTFVEYFATSIHGYTLFSFTTLGLLRLKTKQTSVGIIIKRVPDRPTHLWRLTICMKPVRNSNPKKGIHCKNGFEIFLLLEILYSTYKCCNYEISRKS